VLILGWLAMLATAYKCMHIQQDAITWDPFEILEIPPVSALLKSFGIIIIVLFNCFLFAFSQESPVADIKKAYRKLSLIYHPDKETGNQEHFVKLTKAYAALTDETSRKNWEQYGNPDGPGATSFGIALPSWIVEKENSVIVLGIYVLLFMIALPIVAGIWWNRSLKFGGDQVLMDTTQMYYYFIHKTPQMMLKRVIMILAASFEFEPGHNSEIQKRQTDETEMPQLLREIDNLGDTNKERPMCFAYSVKARALIHAHLARIRLPAKTLDVDRSQIVVKVPYLIQEFILNVAQLNMLALIGRIPRMPSLETLENAMKLCPMVVQALWQTRDGLLQLPHVTSESMRHFVYKKKAIRGIQQLAMMKEEDRRNMLQYLNQEQYQNMIHVLSKLPLLKVEVNSIVLDDEDSRTITAGSIVTVSVHLQRQMMEVLMERSSKAQDDQKALAELEQEYASEELNANAENKSSTQAKKPVWKKNNRKNHKGGKGKKKAPAKRVPLPQQKSSASVSETGTETPIADKDETKEERQSESDNDNEETADTYDSNESQSEGDEQPLLKKQDKPGKESESDDEDWKRYQEDLAKKEKILDSKPKTSHLVHCPFFPDNKYECWWIYLIDRKKNALASIPVLMTNLIDEEEIELKFTAPIKPGVYNYAVVVRSDSYVDITSTQNLKVRSKGPLHSDLFICLKFKLISYN
jgi:translocation protein SEC63